MGTPRSCRSFAPSRSLKASRRSRHAAKRRVSAFTWRHVKGEGLLMVRLRCAAVDLVWGSLEQMTGGCCRRTVEPSVTCINVIRRDVGAASCVDALQLVVKDEIFVELPRGRR